MEAEWEWGVADNAQTPHCWIENNVTGETIAVHGVTERVQTLAETLCRFLNNGQG